LIATLAWAGLVKDIFTLDFDTLHEQAFKERGVPFETVVGDRGTDRPADEVTVYKLHGSVDDLSTIKATLDQTTTTKGIGPISKQRLVATRAQCHLLVLGYSGGNFFLDLDYLGLVSLSAPTTIIWNVLPGEAAQADHP
jgi:SIR2-like domain